MDKKDVLNCLKQIKAELEEVSLKLWNDPEVAGKEEKSANLLRQILRSHGFAIKEIAGMEHAFIAEYGKGAPVIAILAEYDALPGLSQRVDTKKNPVKENTPGHGCGHNLLGAATLGAVLAVQQYLADAKSGGTIRFYGCPEEETLAGKVKMIKKGAFEGCDIALSWHPMGVNTAYEQALLSLNSIKYRFHGTSSHAALSPEQGRSALDAVELMNVGANYLREHVIDRTRIHYTITNAGGAPNIIPSEAESWYYIRAPFREDVEEISERLSKIAQGAATMTETTADYEIISGCYEMLPNKVLFDLTYENMVQISPPEYTSSELSFARELQKTLIPGDVEKAVKKLISPGSDEIISIHQGVIEREKAIFVDMPASSDIGDVSWIMPMNLFSTACWPLGTPNHSWQAVAATGSSLGLKGMHYAAQILAGIMYDLLKYPNLVADAKREFSRRTEKRKYVSPIK